jgi:hypothetical protein
MSHGSISDLNLRISENLHLFQDEGDVIFIGQQNIARQIVIVISALMILIILIVD